MSGAENDPTVRRAVDELRRLPPLDRDAVQRVVRAAAEARVTPADDPLIVAPRGRSIRLWSAIGMAAAAALVAWVVGRGTVTPSVDTVAVAPPPASSQAQLVASGKTEALPILQQFVFENAKARSVSVVGDFNKWNPAANVMKRTSEGLWSVMVPIMPGRHVYGFMVDDSVFTLDPRAPKVRDPDLGSEGSVVLVGRP
jgi:hypothetical protein